MGIGLVCLLAGIGIALCIGSYQGDKKSIAEIELGKAKVEKGYVLQERDLNHNGLLERFYEIDGKKVFLSIDGKNVEDSLGD